MLVPPMRMAIHPCDIAAVYSCERRESRFRLQTDYRGFRELAEAFLPECLGTKPYGRWTRTLGAVATQDSLTVC